MTAAKTQTIEELEAEITALHEHLTAAQRAVEDAGSGLQDMDRQKDELSAGVFRGDSEAIASYEELEASERETTRALRIARTISAQLAEQIAVTKQELARAQRRDAYARYESLTAEMNALAEEGRDYLLKAKEAFDGADAIHGQRLEAAAEVGDSQFFVGASKGFNGVAPVQIRRVFGRLEVYSR
jgi:predicted RNase H-like nuclease (RuvC/YqgF family)